MDNICVIAQLGAFGNAPAVAAALSLYGNTLAVFREKNWKSMDSQAPKVAYGYNNIPSNYDKYIVVSATTLLDLETARPDIIPTHAILTDSNYVKHSDKINRMTRHIPTFIMPDLVKHRKDLPYKLYYHPFNLENITINKNTEFTVAHSPATKSKMKQKGSNIIIKTMSNLPVRFECILNKTWEETLKIKSSAHIFIDQIDDTRKGYNPALGKSGIEGMLLKCLTMSNFTYIKSDIPYPPIVQINASNLDNNLKYYINNEEARNQKIQEQFEWAKEYTSYEFVGGRLLA